jgi:hypothetical protein
MTSHVCLIERHLGLAIRSKKPDVKSVRLITLSSILSLTCKLQKRPHTISAISYMCYRIYIRYIFLTKRWWSCSDESLQHHPREEHWEWTSTILPIPAFDKVGPAYHRAVSALT